MDTQRLAARLRGRSRVQFASSGSEVNSAMISTTGALCRAALVIAMAAIGVGGCGGLRKRPLGGDVTHITGMPDGGQAGGAGPTGDAGPTEAGGGQGGGAGGGAGGGGSGGG